MASSLYSSSFKSSANCSKGNPPSWYRELVDVSYVGDKVIQNQTQCVIQFTIPTDVEPPVLFYYQLTNFYQNHRRYVKSLSTSQLTGTALSNSSIKGSACDPLTTDHNGFAYYPCGLIANSLFNDTFSSPALLNPSGSTESDSNQAIPYEMKNNSGIAWSSDKALYGTTDYKFDQVVPPPNWQDRYVNGTYQSQEELPKLEEMENFQVWMRTAGLPIFSKLYQRNDDQTMTCGVYSVNITMSQSPSRLRVPFSYVSLTNDADFPVKEYGGKKKILLSTRTVVGGKNPFLGIAYIVVAGICVVLGTIFTITHLIKPRYNPPLPSSYHVFANANIMHRKLGDHTYLTWNNEPPATAIASGREVRPGDAWTSSLLSPLDGV